MINGKCGLVTVTQDIKITMNTTGAERKIEMKITITIGYQEVFFAVKK